MVLEVFKKEGYEIRGCLINNIPYFIAKDISDALGYESTEKITRRLDDDEKVNLKRLLKTPKKGDFNNLNMNIFIL